MADLTPPTGQQYNPNYNPNSVGPGNTPFIPGTNNITPQPGYMIDPNNPQNVIPVGQSPTTGVTPYSPGQGTGPGTPTLVGETPNYGGTPNTPAASVAGANSVSSVASQTTSYASVAGASSSTATPPPETPPQPTISDIIAGLGPNASQYGTSAVNPAQNAQLASQYNQYFAQTSGSAPNTSPTSDINQAITSAAQPDPQAAYFDSMAAQNPIVAQLYQMTQNIVSPQKTQESFTQEYAQLSAQAGIPQLQSQLLNYQTMMNGTTDDVRSEVTAAGGFATESQVNAIAATRNNVLMKQATQLEGQLSNQQQYVSNVMQYSQADQTQVNTQVNEQTGLLETMASLQQTMNSNAVANYQKTITQLGGDMSAFASTVPPSMQPYVENLMGFAPGTLSNPQELQILTNASYKQIQLQIAAQRAAVYGYNAGYPVNIQTPTSGAGGNTTGTTTDTPTNLNQPISPFLSTSNQSTTGYTVTSQDTGGLTQIAKTLGVSVSALQAANPQITKASGYNVEAGQNLTVPIPVKDNSTGQTGYISPTDFNPSTMTQLGGATVTPPKTATDTAYNAMKAQVDAAAATPVTGSPLNKGRYTRNANSALKNYIASATYQTVSNAVPYLSRIQSALKDPGSITDTSLADSIIKIETGGGQVTDSQISTYFAGQSFADQFAVVGDKIVAKGGVLSPQQRTDLASLAEGTFGYYQQQYEGLYVQAMGALKAQGIPLNYGTNLPDFNSLLAQTAPTALTQ